MADAGDVLHVVIGPEEHGVVRHAVSVARACGQPLLRAERPEEVDPHRLTRAAVIHLPFTERLFAPTAEAAAAAYETVVAPAVAAGVAVSVTLHDLPSGSSPLQERRRAAYDRVVASARGIVVNSRLELELVGGLRHCARSLRMIPLPIEAAEPGQVALRQAQRPSPSNGVGWVAVLGFLFPDRGYEQVIAALPEGAELLALGRPAVGHEDLAEALVAQAAAAGHSMRVTGFLPDADLAGWLRSVAVPVAPNARVGASASIATWIGHGRRPLVPESAYGRELAERAPGTVTLYPTDSPDRLRTAIEAALTDPASTRIGDEVWLGPGTAEVAAGYARHFAGCRPPAPLRVRPGRWTVPDNRWDLLAGLEPPEPPAVSVVVPYFQAQPRLDLVLAALSVQAYPATRLEVVVADDGSATAPDLSAAAGLATRLVRQPDQGFRAAAARNLGAAAAGGEVLLFLDGDTVPEPDYVRRLARLPALAPDALVVGRRRHADLTGWDPERLVRWLAEDGPGPVELTEPEWLRAGYAASRDLLDADERSYRFVISAVCGLTRDLFTELGGFDPGFTGYGGEDWDLAHRAWVAGALLAHLPDAVAWHHGPDWADRNEGEPAAKNVETRRLATVLPDPVARGGGQWLPYPAIVVTVPDEGPDATLATARWAFRGDTDCGIWVTGPTAADTVAQLADPRIRSGAVPDAVRTRAQAVVDLTQPARLEDLSGLVEQALRLGPLAGPAGTVTAERARRRAARWAPALDLDPVTVQAWLFGGRDGLVPRRFGAVDLAHELKYVGQPVRRS